MYCAPIKAIYIGNVQVITEIIKLILKIAYDSCLNFKITEWAALRDSVETHICFVSLKAFLHLYLMFKVGFHSLRGAADNVSNIQ